MNYEAIKINSVFALRHCDYNFIIIRNERRNGTMKGPKTFTTIDTEAHGQICECRRFRSASQFGRIDNHFSGRPNERGDDGTAVNVKSRVASPTPSDDGTLGHDRNKRMISFQFIYLKYRFSLWLLPRPFTRLSFPISVYLWANFSIWFILIFRRRRMRF